MEILHTSALMVKCPHCGNRFTPEDAIGHDLKERMEKEFDQKLQDSLKHLEVSIAKREHDKYHSQIKQIEEDRKAKTVRLRELESAALQLAQKERQIAEREEELELRMKKQFLEREKLLKEQAEKAAYQKLQLDFQEREQKLQREQEALEITMRKRTQEETEKVRIEERMKSAELQKKLEDQNKLIHEMKRKSEQGSMQMQGEVQELAIEEYLRNTFPRDTIEEVSKGKRGGDCIHIVKDHYHRMCGRVLYESKRTKHFSYEWIAKLKDDMRLNQADVGVIVTEAFPDGMNRFGEIEGVWICSLSEFKALSILFRSNLIRIGEVLSSQENKGDKMQMIYSYVSSNEFKQKLEAAFESYSDMQEDLIREKTIFTAHWAKREKKLLKAMENLVSLYGDVRGIAGGAVPEIACLEMNERLLL